MSDTMARLVELMEEIYEEDGIPEHDDLLALCRAEREEAYDSSRDCKREGRYESQEHWEEIVYRFDMLFKELES